ncbi:hypothetical protein Sru01_07040 [Sphaerisporangium rufum]|uniref:Uncharacterized protein n=1 Tax=Sphaerisporangium rufum TaxID=1381558 RepID=A0A919QXE4_9ACTN|nr:hypothetical protein Sru01_07040 [Sphaerisporangium rufum]
MSAASEPCPMFCPEITPSTGAVPQVSEYRYRCTATASALALGFAVTGGLAHTAAAVVAAPPAWAVVRASTRHSAVTAPPAAAHRPILMARASLSARGVRPGGPDGHRPGPALRRPSIASRR